MKAADSFPEPAAFFVTKETWHKGMDSSHPILEFADVSINFGGLQAINRLSLRVESSQIFALIGPNGAGKTTAINLITGVYHPAEGEIYFEGQALSRKRPHQVARMGIARTFQNIQVFQNMTVRENVMVGFHIRSRSEFVQCLLHTPMVRREERMIQERCDEILRMMELAPKADFLAAGLPYGDQKKVEIARTLATEPRLLLLDEPAAGLNPQETHEMSHTILRIREKGVTVLLVAHDMNLVMGISDTIAVLNYGERIALGRPEDIQSSEKVISAYLGREPW
jgi:branched-chain amino acid transport system ATP-binding protein